MSFLLVNPSKIKGNIIIPPSKSHTLRALIFGMMATSKTVIHDYLNSPDTFAMINALRVLGAQVTISPKKIEIEPSFRPAEDIIHAGNSGQVLRFIGALSALLPTYTVITGDASVRSNRPIKPLLEGLNQLGAFATSTKFDDTAPILIKGPLTPGSTFLCGADSQPVSALLIAACFLNGSTQIKVTNPGEKPWIDLTLSWLDRFRVSYSNNDYKYYTVHGPISYRGFEMTIPGDFSSAAYSLIAALITNSEITLYNIDMNDIQGDKKIVDILIQMGANIEIGMNTLTVHQGNKLKGIQIDVNDCIDAITILAVLGCYAEGTTKLIGGTIARKKESDRIHAIATELRKMGAQIEEKEDGLIIKTSSLHGSILSSHFDHRIALSLAVAALGAEGETIINNSDCIEKSYHSFVQDFSLLGAKIKKCV